LTNLLNQSKNAIEGRENGQSGKDRRGSFEPHRARSRRTRQAFGRKMGCVRSGGSCRGGGAGGWRRSGCASGGANRVHGNPCGDRRQENRSHQGSACRNWPWPQGGEGSGRSRAQARQGGREQGRGRENQGCARKSGCQGGVEVIVA